MTTTLRHWIDGRYQQGSGFVERVRPVDGDVFARVPIASHEEINGAVRAARTALDNWRQVTVEDRCRMVGAMSKWLADSYGAPGEITPIKKLISDEVGKPLPEADTGLYLKR